jgi:hypothetical protein
LYKQGDVFPIMPDHAQPVLLQHMYPHTFC